MAEYQASLGDVLDACLEAIEKQGWTVDECLAHYASYRTDLEPLLETANQFRQARQLTPSLEFRERSLARLRTRIQQSPRRAAEPTPSPAKAPSRPFFPQRQFMFGAAALVTAIGLTLAGAGTIYAAGNALPGEPLYPIEQVVEQTRLNFASPENVLDLRMDLAEKRLSEAERLLLKGDETHVQTALDGYDQLVSGLIQIAGSSDPAWLDKVSARLAAQQTRLETLLGAASPTAQAGIAASIALIEDQMASIAQTIDVPETETPTETETPPPAITAQTETEETAAPTKAAAMVDTPTPTDTATATASLTVKATAKATATDTPRPATDEPTDASTDEPAAEPTDAPTDTAAPASTTEPTEAPPTNVAASSCGNVSMVWRDTTGNSVRITVTNNNDSPISLTNVKITWPEGNKNLKHIKFTGVLWDGDAAPPTFETGVSGSSAELSAQTPADLQFQFGAKAASSGYAIVVNVNIGCTLTVNH